MDDPQVQLGRTVDLIDIECGAHYQVVDENTKDGSVLMQCLKCSRFMIVREFVPNQKRAKSKPQPDPSELDTRSDQEISDEVREEPTEPQETNSQIESEPTEE